MTEPKKLQFIQSQDIISLIEVDQLQLGVDEQVQGIKQVASSPPGTQLGDNNSLPVRGGIVQKYSY